MTLSPRTIAWAYLLMSCDAAFDDQNRLHKTLPIGCGADAEEHEPDEAAMVKHHLDAFGETSLAWGPEGLRIWGFTPREAPWQEIRDSQFRFAARGVEAGLVDV